jgi:hypothetical protein
MQFIKVHAIQPYTCNSLLRILYEILVLGFYVFTNLHFRWYNIQRFYVFTMKSLTREHSIYPFSFTIFGRARWYIRTCCQSSRFISISPAVCQVNLILNLNGMFAWPPMQFIKVHAIQPYTCNSLLRILYEILVLGFMCNSSEHSIQIEYQINLTDSWQLTFSVVQYSKVLCFY